MSTIVVVVAYGSWELEHSQRWATQVQAPDRQVIIIGITRQPQRSCWRVGLSWQGAPPTWISAHRLKRAAEAQVARVGQLIQHAGCGDRDSCTRVAHQLTAYSDVALGDGRP